MNLHRCLKWKRARANQGWALLAVMTIGLAILLIVAGYMSWSNQNAATTSRRNEFFSTAYAAEAATEKALSAMVRDDQVFGEGYVLGHLSNYSAMVPTTSDDAYWGNYGFSAGGNTNSLLVTMISSNMSAILGAPYTGLNSQGFTYEIIGSAQNVVSMYNIPATVGQRVVFSQIPMFQFAIFYDNDLEIDPGANMTVNGPVHGNGAIYTDPNPGVTLTFSNDVSASAKLLSQEDPNDPTSRSGPGTINFYGAHVSSVNPLELPGGGGTNTDGGYLLQPPTPGQPNTNGSLLYNQVQVIVLVSNNSVTVTSGTANNQATVVPQNQWAAFISANTNNNFYDQRDGLTVNTVQVDIGNLGAWSKTNTAIGPIDSIYIADFRSTSNQVIVTNTYFTTNTTYSTNSVTHSVTTNSTPVTNTVTSTNFPFASQPGIVLTNGATLPSSAGLGIATPDPVYIVGNWNVSTNGTAANLGTANTSQTYPSAIYSDAVTVLSPSWNNANSASPLSSRVASSDTVNAAFFTGNVPSNGSYYSGGAENFPRFLETWSGKTFTYNGSMVEAFYSKIANFPWPGTGTVYNPPVRNWAFDLNFNDPSKLPPLTPRVVYIQRTGWSVLAPNATSF
jgi:hypothetical protein